MQNKSLYKNQHGEVSRKSSTVLILSFLGDTTELNFCGLLSLNNKMNAINWEVVLSADTDVELVRMCHTDRIWALSALELIKLQDLVQGTLATLELYSIISALDAKAHTL